MTLDELRVGRSAHIIAIDETHPSSTQLCEMGLLPGELIELISKAPFGDPLKIEVMGYTLCLRKKDANAIRIEPHQGGSRI